MTHDTTAHGPELPAEAPAHAGGPHHAASSAHGGGPQPESDEAPTSREVHDVHDVHGSHHTHGSRDVHGSHGSHDMGGSHGSRDVHGSHDMGSTRVMAASATLHCLTGCAIGEISGLVIGTALGASNAATIVLSIALAFLFGYGLSSLPLLRSGLPLARALRLVLAADTISIATMEVVDNAVVALVPGAMNAGLVNPLFWLSMMLSLVAAFAAAYPVNLVLLGRGKGHALTHGYHADAAPEGLRRFIPAFGTVALAAVLAAFLAGGLLVSVADALS